jgi:hypothetical protein
MTALYEEERPEHEYDSDEEGGVYSWEKPSWIKSKLKSTGKMDVMKTDGNLAAPITFTPFKNEDHSNSFANQGVLYTTQDGDAAREGINLAAPITFTPFKNEDHTNYVASPTKLKPTALGEKMKTEGNLANPITNIRDIKTKKTKKKSSQ